MRNTLLIIMLFAAALVSCNKEKDLYDEVMAVHDTAMVKMDKIVSLKSDLKEKAQQLSEDTAAENTEKIKEINNLISDLNAADESMMNWMREFHQNYENQAKEEIMDYLHKQKERITMVGKEMNEAIKAAEAYLKNSE